jgi:hypothetical protein
MNGQDKVQSRGKRDFLKIVLGSGLAALAGAILYPIFAYLKPPVQAEAEVKSVSAGKTGDMAPDSGKIVKFGSKPVILIRTADDQFKA